MAPSSGGAPALLGTLLGMVWALAGAASGGMAPSDDIIEVLEKLLAEAQAQLKLISTGAPSRDGGREPKVLPQERITLELDRLLPPTRNPRRSAEQVAGVPGSEVVSTDCEAEHVAENLLHELEDTVPDVRMTGTQSPSESQIDPLTEPEHALADRCEPGTDSVAEHAAEIPSHELNETVPTPFESLIDPLTEPHATQEGKVQPPVSEFVTDREIEQVTTIPLHVINEAVSDAPEDSEGLAVERAITEAGPKQWRLAGNFLCCWQGLYAGHACWPWNVLFSPVLLAYHVFRIYVGSCLYIYIVERCVSLTCSWATSRSEDREFGPGPQTLGNIGQPRQDPETRSHAERHDSSGRRRHVGRAARKGKRAQVRPPHRRILWDDEELEESYFEELEESYFNFKWGEDLHAA